MPEDLKPSLDRLRSFRQSWNAGDLIDEESGLTADDLTKLIEAVEQVVYVPRMR